MNKNIIIIVAILVIPLGVYWGLTRDRLTTLPSIALEGAQIIKFSSPMCYECQELEKVFDGVYPKYNSKISLKKIDVTKKDNATRSLIKEHNVKLVPTTIFRDKNGVIKRRLEGSVSPEVLETYMEEIIDG